MSPLEHIDADYENLRSTLPKSEYQELDNQMLGQAAAGVVTERMIAKLESARDLLLPRLMNEEIAV